MWSIVIAAAIFSEIPGASASSESLWMERMQAKGYKVQEGMFEYFDVKTCAHTDTCYAINPLTPYGLIYLPPHPEEAATEKSYKNSCHGHGLCKMKGNVTFAPSWRVAPGETIVLVGKTPPEATYWSFSNYLYTRFNQAGFTPQPKDFSHMPVACPRVPKDSPGARCEVFAGINDPLNMLTVNASSAFSAPFSMILSWDTHSEQMLADELAADGEIGPVNHLRFPGSILNLGVTRGDEDEFLNVMRLEGVMDAAARNEFYKNTPFRVFRVTPGQHMQPPPESAAHPSYEGKMRPRVTGRTEAAPGVSTQDIIEGQKMLREMLIHNHTHRIDFGRDYASLDFESFVNDSGYECLHEGTRCQGDCRDTIYAKATFMIAETLCNRTRWPCKPAERSELSEEAADALYVIGVNHQRTKQSRYSSLTLYNYPKLAAGILQPSGFQHQTYALMEDDYADTGKRYLEGHPAAPYLYVVKFARKCSADDTDFCVEVPASSNEPDVTALPLSSQLVFIERMYIKPGLESGPAVSETILPKLLHFRPRFSTFFV